MTEKWPSVTTVLSIFSDFSRIDPRVLQVAAERGTRVHQACAAIAQGLFVGEIPEDLQGYVASFRRWFETVETVELVEQRLQDAVFQYHGTPDMVVRLRGDQAPRLIDLKTPYSKGKLWASQIAAYNRLFTVSTGQECEHSGTLRLRRDGRPPIFDECRHGASDLQGFLCALGAYRHFMMED
jgi:hypothetical protein